MTKLCFKDSKNENNCESVFMSTYSSRAWLNRKGKPSSGTVVAYKGKDCWSEELLLFFEVSDCHNKVRLHKTERDSVKDFCKKLKILAEEALKFYDYLENDCEKNSNG